MSSRPLRLESDSSSRPAPALVPARPASAAARPLSAAARALAEPPSRPAGPLALSQRAVSRPVVQANPKPEGAFDKAVQEMISQMVQPELTPQKIANLKSQLDDLDKKLLKMGSLEERVAASKILDGLTDSYVRLKEMEAQGQLVERASLRLEVHHPAAAPLPRPGPAPQRPAPARPALPPASAALGQPVRLSAPLQTPPAKAAQKPLQLSAAAAAAQAQPARLVAPPVAVSILNQVESFEQQVQRAVNGRFASKQLKELESAMEGISKLVESEALLEKINSAHKQLVTWQQRHYEDRLKGLLEAGKVKEVCSYPNQYQLAKTVKERSICTAYAVAFISSCLSGSKPINESSMDVVHFFARNIFELALQRQQGSVKIKLHFDEVVRFLPLMETVAYQSLQRTQDAVADFTQVLLSAFEHIQDKETANIGCVITTAGETFSVAIRKQGNKLEIIYFNSHGDVNKQKGDLYSISSIKEAAVCLAARYPYSINGPLAIQQGIDQERDFVNIAYTVVKCKDELAAPQSQQQQAAVAAAPRLRQERPEIPEQKQ